METEYCEKCGVLHDPDDGECLGCQMAIEIKELKRIISLASCDFKDAVFDEEGEDNDF